MFITLFDEFVYMLKLPTHSPSRKAGGNVSDKSLACAGVEEKNSVEKASETNNSLLHTFNGEEFIGTSHNERILILTIIPAPESICG